MNDKIRFYASWKKYCEFEVANDIFDYFGTLSGPWKMKLLKQGREGQLCQGEGTEEDCMKWKITNANCKRT